MAPGARTVLLLSGSTEATQLARLIAASGDIELTVSFAGRTAARAPTPEGVRSLTRDMLSAHYQRIYRPQGGRITVLGDVRERDITPKLEALLANWTGAGTKPPDLALPGPLKGRTVILVDRPKSVQTSFYLGNRALDIVDVLKHRN